MRNQNYDKNLSKKKIKDLRKKNASNIKKVIDLNKPHLKESRVFNEKKEFFINLLKVNKFYTNGFVIKLALKNINLSIKKGSFVVIVGKSGSGKTTLMNIMSGLTRASNGIVSIGGENLITYKNSELGKFRKKNISFVFQQYGLVQTLTVYENIKSGALLANSSISKEKILKMLDVIGIKNQSKSFPKQLSGGQQQKTSIARALIKNPQILFCDEPTGALDSTSSFNILQLFKQINQKNKTTIIIITHDSRIGKLADHLIEIEDGKIIKNNQQIPLNDFKNLFI